MEQTVVRTDRATSGKKAGTSLANAAKGTILMTVLLGAPSQ
jgi:hypothetical protein